MNDTKVKDRPQAKLSDGSGVKPMKRHLVPKDEDGKPKDTALCGALWDHMIDSQQADIGQSTCEACVAERRRLEGW